MADFVEREKVLAEYDRQHKGPPGGARKIIETFPAADVRPVVRAVWEQVEVRYEDELIDNPVQAVASMFCPNCKRYHNEVYFYGMPTEQVNFCPNCGADMRGEKS